MKLINLLLNLKAFRQTVDTRVAQIALVKNEHGHSVIHASVNTLKSAGLLEGVMAGASIGSVISGVGTAVGAGVGFAVGTANWLWGEADKMLGTKSKDNVYKNVEHFLGGIYDGTIGKLAGA